MYYYEEACWEVSDARKYALVLLPVYTHIYTHTMHYSPSHQRIHWLDAAQRPANEFSHLRVSALVGIVHTLHDLEQEPLAAFGLIEDLLQCIAGG